MTAFFVKAVFTPIAWILRQLFNLVVVPLYRLYSLLDKRVAVDTSSAPSGFPNVITGRYTIHVLVIIVAGCLVYFNLKDQPAALSSEELVGQTLLAQLVIGDTSDLDQPITEYPRSDIGLWFQHTQGPVSILHTPRNIFTKEQATETPAPGQSGVATRSAPITYTVQNGDTISGIARRFGVSVNTILWENDLTANSLIKPGAQLTILPATGVSHTVSSGQTLGQIASLYGVDAQAIMKANGIANANQLRIGSKLVIPNGNKIVATNSSTRVVQQVSKSIGIIKKIINPAPSAVIPSGDRMAWPTTGHTITQYFSWRHTGVDIANHIGTPIYAADSGTVVTRGWNSGGYGNQIVIDHGGGKKTRYAHLSAFNVNAGQKVSKGQYIGAMGSTGRSTGPHLHFEVIINGKVYNPLNYAR